MSESYTVSESETFTIAHARYLASKMATDLQRFQRLYGSPSDEWIGNYEAELTQLLKHKVLRSVTYGFKRSGCWTAAAVQYAALPDGTLTADDDPGKIPPGLDIADAAFTSFLEYNSRWTQISADDRATIRNACPFQRVNGTSPPLESGSWVPDLRYAAGGQGIGRSRVHQ